MGTVDLLLLRFHVAWAQRRNPCRPGATCRHQRRQLQHWARGGGSSTSRQSWTSDSAAAAGLEPAAAAARVAAAAARDPGGGLCLCSHRLLRTVGTGSRLSPCPRLREKSGVHHGKDRRLHGEIGKPSVIRLRERETPFLHHFNLCLYF